MIDIYDGNNFYRHVLETDPTGFAPRTMLTKFLEPKNPIIWVWDGANGNRRRRELFDGYKRNRKPVDKDIYAGFDMLEEILKFTPVIQVKVPDYEGDDVVATLAKMYAERGEQIAIFSNDFDFGQLVGQYPGKILGGFRSKQNVSPEHARLFKICVGDPSDNIPGIKGFGMKTWDAIDKDVLSRWLDDILNDGTVGDIGLPPRIKVDVEQIRTFAKIIDFFEVPISLINENMVVGSTNYSAADAYLKEFFQ